MDLVATYRLQLTPRFGFDAARAVLPYLADLGVSHVYLSPCLEAMPGSEHGYDVVDPTRVDTARGGEAAFAALLVAAQECGLGVVLDIVPNHVAASELNPWWRDVLARGRDSPFAGWFDIDWEPPDPGLRGRVLLPILGAPLDAAIASGDVRVVEDGAEPELLVHDRRLPLSEASVARGLHRAGDLRELLDAQAYRLAFWREGLARLNWRRFFEVTSLAGIRVERDDVFRAVHGRVLEAVRQGLVHGLRVDHPDGLRDPGGYVATLRAAAPGCWITVEKILQPDEELPHDWPVDGTTGYDFLNAAQALFVDPDGEGPLTELCAAVTGSCPPFDALRRAKKRLAVEELFAAELARLVRLFAALAEEHRVPAADPALPATLVAVLVAFPVYRTYVGDEGAADARDRRYLEAAFARAERETPPPDAALAALLHGALAGELRGATAVELRARFQQLSGPAMAKGLEDTALYCDRRLIAIDEVGSDPARFGTTVERFHRFCEATHARWPDTMATTSTHDTKRSADTRLRIAVLSETPEAWGREVRAWFRHNDRHKGAGRLDPGTEYVLYQTLVGCWPAAPERIVGALAKAAREAKEHTSWLDPDPDYEARLERFVGAVLADSEFTSRVGFFVGRLLPAARRHSLAMTLLKLTACGVPDLYQGCEVWREDLVDPDNRRDVDFDALRERLADVAELGPEQALADAAGGAKLWLVQRVLELRRRHGTAFGRAGRYTRLPVEGRDSERVVAYRRGEDVAVVVPRLTFGASPERLDAAVHVGPGGWRSELADEEIDGPSIPAATLWRRFPVSVLVRTAT